MPRSEGFANIPKKSDPSTHWRSLIFDFPLPIQKRDIYGYLGRLARARLFLVCFSEWVCRVSDRESKGFRKVCEGPSEVGVLVAQRFGCRRDGWDRLPAGGGGEAFGTFGRGSDWPPILQFRKRTQRGIILNIKELFGNGARFGE